MPLEQCRCTFIKCSSSVTCFTTQSCTFITKIINTMISLSHLCIYYLAPITLFLLGEHYYRIAFCAVLFICLWTRSIQFNFLSIQGCRVKPNSLRCACSSWWLTVFKAYEMSRKTTPTLRPWSKALHRIVGEALTEIKWGKKRGLF